MCVCVCLNIMKKTINVSGLNFIFHMNIAVSWDIRVGQNVCLSLFEAGDCIHIDCPGSCLASLFEPTWWIQHMQVPPFKCCSAAIWTIAGVDF